MSNLLHTRFLRAFAPMLLVSAMWALPASASFSGSDLRLSKTVSDSTPAVGEVITFTVTLANHGDRSNHIQVDDQIYDPNGCFEALGQPQFSTGTWTGTPDDGYRWRGDLGGGETLTVRQNGKIRCDSWFSNKAWVSDDGHNADINTSDNEATVGVDPVASTDLILDKTVSISDPVVGQRIAFELTVTNDGPAVWGAIIQDVMVDPSTCYTPINRPVASTGSIHLGDLKTATWVLDLPAGGSATLRSTGWVNCDTPFTNTATIESGGQVPDLNLVNNKVQVVVRPSQGKTIDLEVDKIVDNPYPLAGDIVTFTVTLFNNTADKDGRVFPTNIARNIQVADYLPHGLTLQSHSTSIGTYDESTGTWHLDELYPGKAVSISFRALVEAEGEYINCAEVWDADMPDRDSFTGAEAGGPLVSVKREDDESCAGVWAGPLLTDLEVSKVVDNDHPIQDDIITYTITVRNRAVEQGREIPTADATNLVIADYLQPGQYLIPSSASTGGANGITFDPVNLEFRIERLPAGKALSLSFQAEMREAGEYQNCAEVRAVTEFDRDSHSAIQSGGPLLGDEDDQACVSVWVEPRRPDLELVKTTSNDTPRIGDTLTYSLTLTNRQFVQGVERPTATATNIVVTDYLPSGLWFEEGSATDGSQPGVPTTITFDRSTLSWHVEELLPGKSVNLSFRIRVDAGGEFRNCAEVWDADQADRDSRSGAEAYGKLVGGPDAEDDQDCVSIWVDQAPQPTGSVSGVVFHDENHNGVIDHYEAGLPGFEIDLLEIGLDRTCGTFDDTEIASLDSDKNGSFTFWDVDPGEYCVRILDITIPAGYFRTTAARVPVWVGSGAHLSGVLFGFRESYPSYPQPPADDPLCYLTGPSKRLSTVRAGAPTDVLLAEMGGSDVAAVAYSPWSEALFASDGGSLSRIDPVSGATRQLGAHGSGTGAAGPLVFDTVSGLSFDPFSSRLFGSVTRDGAPDVIIELDPLTGQAVRGSFGPNDDYLLIGSDLRDVDDIAIDPVDGALYALGSSDGFSASLARVDRQFGTIDEVRNLGSKRMAALSFFNNGTLYASGDEEKGVPVLITIDKLSITITIEATLGLGIYGTGGEGIGYGGTGAPVGPGYPNPGSGSGSGTGSGDDGYGSLSCLTGKPNRVGTTLFADSNGDGQKQAVELGLAGIGVDLFRDLNANGIVDTADILVSQTLSNDQGAVSFDAASNGDFLMQVVTSTLPFGAATQSGPVATAAGGFGLDASAGAIAFGGVTSTDTEDAPVSEVPEGFALEGNYPNPFNPQTTVAFAAPQTGHVRLAVYDVLGREVALLIDGVVEAGRHEVSFSADRLPSGTYFARMVATGMSVTRPMMLIK